MSPPTVSTETVLESIMRGAATILGCASANLLLFDEAARRVHIRVGTIGGSARRRNDIEASLGVGFQRFDHSFDEARDSIVTTARREQRVCETSRFAELVGSAFPTSLTEQVAAMLGEHRFICVPVPIGRNATGIVVFSKEGPHPFGPQQRQVLLRYAQRIGEILDNELRGRLSMERMADRRAGGGAAEQSDASTLDPLLSLAFADSVPALTVDPDLVITSCNEATERLFGYSPAELVGEPVGSLLEDPEAFHPVLNGQFLFLSDGYYEDLAAVRDRQGRVFRGRVKALLLADEDDRVIGFLVVIEKATGSDSHPVVERRDGVVRQERLATMGELAAQLAHEIRNPLVSIGATLNMLSEDIEDQMTKTTMASVVREIERLDMLLKDYLSLAVRRDAATRRTNLFAVVEAARGLHAGRAVEIIDDVPPDMSVLADHEELKQVVFNLLLNAVEASGSSDEPIRVGAENVDGGVSIYVDDRGTGLATSTERCLRPFFTTKKHGTGIGLTVCHKIISARGGKLMLANRSNGGCRATVWLPTRSDSQ